MGATAWYVAHRGGEWLALAVFSAAARKCRARDEWIGWDFRTQHGRLHLIANNARFLILPGRGVPNLGSRVLGLCARRLARDWPARFGHPVLMLETFVDAARFRGTVYRAAGWLAVGQTRGFRRHRSGYVAGSTPKLVLLRPLVPDACRRLSAAGLDRELWKKGVPRTMISAAQQESLYACFKDIDDPRTRKGRRHSLPSVLALASGATLCGMRGWKAMSEWVDDLGEKGAGPLRRAAARRGAPAAFDVDHPQCGDPGGPGPVGRGVAQVAGGPRLRRRGACPSTARP